MATNGVITLSGTAGLSIPGGANGSGHMVLWGTEADINAALEDAVFTPTGNFSGTADIVVESKIAADLHGLYEFENSGDPGQDTSVGVLQSAVVNGDAAVVTDGTRGDVLSLDGSGDYLQITGEFGQPPDITLAAWVNSNNSYSEVFSVQNRLMLRFDDPNSSRGMNAIYHDGTTYHHTSNGTLLSGTG